MSYVVPPWLWFALGSASFAALTALFAKLAVSSLSADLATVIRTIVILVVATAIVTLRSEWQRPAELPVRSLTFLVLSGVATGLSWICYFRALERGPVAAVVSVDKLSLVLVVVAAAVMNGERPSWPVALGAVLMTAGAVLVSLPSTP